MIEILKLDKTHSDDLANIFQFKAIVKAKGYKYLTGSIIKSNPRSKRSLIEKVNSTL